MLTDSSGNVKNTYAYDPWGNSLGKTEAVSNPWQFASGFYDATTGLYKFGTRYYSPTLGRWTQQDPVGGTVGTVGSGNAYVYAGDNPVMMTDPSGRLYVQVLYTTSYIGPVPVGVNIDSIYLELTGSDLSNVGDAVSVAAGEILNLLPPVPFVASYVRSLVSKAIGQIFGACPEIAIAYHNFDTGSGFTECY